MATLTMRYDISYRTNIHYDDVVRGSQNDGLFLRGDAHLQTSSHGFVPKVPRRCAGTPAAYGTEGNGRRRSKRDLGSA